MRLLNVLAELERRVVGLLGSGSRELMEELFSVGIQAGIPARLLPASPPPLW